MGIANRHVRPSIGVLILSGVLSLTGSGIACAQVATDEDEAAPERVLDEIRVTARKRDERLQDVPVAVTALSEDSLEAAGVVDTRDLAQLSPGLFYESFTPSVPNLYVRGIGTRSYDAGSEASVGTFVDGVYMARFATQIQDLADVERVEVLRGPQGALFGRNTIGGAINVVTRKPGDTLEADASVYYGRSEPFDGDEFSFSGLVGGPIVADRLSGQISYSRRDVDGAMRLEGTDEYANGGGSETARARLLVTPWPAPQQWSTRCVSPAASR